MDFRSKLLKLDLQKVGIYEIIFGGVSPHPSKVFFFASPRRRRSFEGSVAYSACGNVGREAVPLFSELAFSTNVPLACHSPSTPFICVVRINE